MEEASEEAGFTLIELMVVLLIMGILMAIAIPTFLGAASGAHNTAAQSDLTNAMTSAKSIYASNGTYGTATSTAVTSLTKAEPEMHFTATTTSTKGSTYIGVKVEGTGGNILVLASWAKTTSKCWLATDNESSTPQTINTVATTPAGISYGVANASAAATCTAAKTPGGWTRKYPKT